MVKKIHLLLLILISWNVLKAQLSTGGVPPSFEVSVNVKSTFKEVQTINLPSVDLQKIHQEDSIEDNIKDIPRRFGVAREVDLSIENSGTWESLPNGDRIWRLKIKSPAALSININYDKFYLPKGAEFYLYSNKKRLIGAFTSLNNKIDSSFATRPTEGDEVTLEYYEPSNVIGQGIIELKHVVHGYRSIFEKSKAFGSSGPCNVNINCMEGSRWQDVKRSVAMVLTSNNTRRCSGTLLNNVRQDSIPYFLTAGHCGIANNSIFIFNYESPFCQPNMDGSLNHSITGCITRATNTPSDFHLLELSVSPPDSFKVFYAGWSAIDTPPLVSTAIHHPRGDVKKISIDYEPAISSTYAGVFQNTHWQILDWDIGTTETNSSGSGLFDQNQRIVGQLQGGNASCGNDASDWYGKFSYSWQNDSDSNQQLKYWLNPDNLMIYMLNGLDTDTAEFTTDAEVLFVNGLPLFSCDTNLQPVVSIRNLGNDTLQNLNIHYRLNSGPVNTINWTGNLFRFQIEEIPLGNIGFQDGSSTFAVYSSNPNLLIDQNTSNDTLISFTQTTDRPSYIRLELKTDDYGEETTWNIRDQATNSILYQGGPYPNIVGGQIYVDTLCLYDTCFDYTIFDDANPPDGINGIWGNGYYLITDMRGDTLVYSDNFTGSSQSNAFCLDYLNSINKHSSQNYKIKIYPNPIDGVTFNISTDMDIERIKLFDIHGKLLQEWRDNKNASVLELKDFISSGMYLLSIEDKNGNAYSKKLLVN